MKPSTARVLAYLRLRGAEGASEADIQAATTYSSGAQRVHELRDAGHLIETVYERSPIGAVYARYVLREPRFSPVTGTQEAWL